MRIRENKFLSGKCMATRKVKQKSEKGLHSISELTPYAKIAANARLWFWYLPVLICSLEPFTPIVLCNKA